MKRKYDIAFSLGFCCGCSQSLRAAGLQFSSFPLDWLGIPDSLAAAKVVGEGFEHWMDLDDFKLLDVNHGVGFCTRIYLNQRTQLGYSHEFYDFKRFENVFPDVKLVYDRRIERFMSEMRSAKRILAVYLEHATRGRAEDCAIRETVELLRGAFPHAQVDLLYFYEDLECATPSVVSDSDGITLVAADYRVVEEGRITQFVKLPVLVGFLKKHIVVDDPRTPEERAKYNANARIARSLRWGKESDSVFRRWLNHHAYKTYRTLERILTERGLVQKELPVLFWRENDIAASDV